MTQLIDGLSSFFEHLHPPWVSAFVLLCNFFLNEKQMSHIEGLGEHSSLIKSLSCLLHRTRRGVHVYVRDAGTGDHTGRAVSSG